MTVKNSKNCGQVDYKYFFPKWVLRGYFFFDRKDPTYNIESSAKIRNITFLNFLKFDPEVDSFLETKFFFGIFRKKLKIFDIFRTIFRVAEVGLKKKKRPMQFLTSSRMSILSVATETGKMLCAKM